MEEEQFWEGDDIDRIYIEPPDNNVQSDEDSADEGDGGQIDNLTGRQLLAPAEAVFSSGRRLRYEQWEDEDVLPLSHFARKHVEWKWKKQGDLHVTAEIFPECNYTKYRGMSAVDLFELFMDQTVIDFLTEESSKYAQFLNCNDPKISADEMRCFIGILLVSGYCVLPGEKLYWDNGQDVRNTLIYNSMRRDRYLQIKKFLHFNDNTKLDMTDKMTKLRPFLNLVKERFLHHFVPQPEISYDESMIEYYGRHGCKQFIRGKPIRFGYKVWCINSKSGYLINFEVYQGSIPNSKPDDQKMFGKAAAPLLQLIDDLPPHAKSLPLRFYFDNLFTSAQLLSHLRTLGYKATGTIRENRVPKNCPILPTKEMKKKNRGEYDFALDEQQEILIARWKDNSVVTVASNIHSLNPISMASRYSRIENKRVGIPRPNVIAQYNCFMGGTDQMDANLGTYRTGIRGKKWYWPIFTYVIDACIQNAWILMKAAGTSISQLNFRREVGQYYLKSYGVPPKGGGRTPTFSEDSRVPPDLRYDQIGHFVEEVPNKKRRRCAGDVCNSVGRTQCQKCQVGLCVQCFFKFHTRP